MNTFLNLRKVMHYYANTSQQKINEGDRYRLDRRYTRQYFEIHPKWYEKIYSTISKQIGRKVHIDICGRTNASNMGFDASYCFALKTSDFIKKISSANHFYFDGDIFDPVVFNMFISFIKDHKLNPSLVTFEPVAGLQEYGPCTEIDRNVSRYREIVYGYLQKRLIQVITILKPGGYIYLERPFQSDPILIADFFRGVPRNKMDISMEMKKIARRHKCKIEVSNDIHGPHFLIHKPF